LASRSAGNCSADSSDPPTHGGDGLETAIGIDFLHGLQPVGGTAGEGVRRSQILEQDY